jgi:hypothetical protein
MFTQNPVPDEHISAQQLETSVSWTGPGRIRRLFYRLRLAVSEMNYASRRVVEVQAPWAQGR